MKKHTDISIAILHEFSGKLWKLTIQLVMKRVPRVIFTERDRAARISGDLARCYINDIIGNHNAPIMPGDLKGLNTNACQQRKNFLSHSGTHVIPVRFARLTIPL